MKAREKRKTRESKREEESKRIFEEDVGQSESCVVCLSLVLSLMSTESLSEVLRSTMSLTVVFVILSLV